MIKNRQSSKWVLSFSRYRLQCYSPVVINLDPQLWQQLLLGLVLGHDLKEVVDQSRLASVGLIFIYSMSQKFMGELEVLDQREPIQLGLGPQQRLQVLAPAIELVQLPVLHLISQLKHPRLLEFFAVHFEQGPVRIHILEDLIKESGIFTGKMMPSLVHLAPEGIAV